MIKIENLDKNFGLQPIFDNVSFHMNAGERVGLVGRNGHGKTTLLKMIIGEDHPDAGQIVIPKNYTIGYVTQHLAFTEKTIVEEGCRGLPEHHEDEKWKVEKILFGLGFSREDMGRDPAEFSGGYQVRLNLGKVLVSEPNLLLLDEPTNYLDVVSIRWLSKFLQQWERELLLVTHDRSFMDSVITHTVGIHRQKTRKIEGNTSKLYQQILKEEEIHEKTRVNDEKKRKEAELFISRFRAKARLAGMVQSRIKALEKQDRLDKLETIKTLDFAFNSKPFNAKTMLNISDLSFSYDPALPRLIDKLNMAIGSHDRICVIGKNGKGKTTLLKLLANELTPVEGEIAAHPNTDPGYFAQTNIQHLNARLTIEDELVSSGCDRQRARDIAGAVMFQGDDALKKISVLSGGEKSRVLLGKLLATPSNLLLLDEPTNHLDMESCDALMAAIDEFNGAVIIVTHNEMFLNTLATRFVVFQSDGVHIHEGSYQSFLEKIGWEDEEPVNQGRTGEEGLAEKKEPINKKDLRKLRADITTRRSKAIKPLETKISKIEASIEENEAILAKLNTAIIEASSAGEGEKIAQLSKELHTCQKEIDSLYEEFERYTIEYDEKALVFDEELKQLEE